MWKILGASLFLFISAVGVAPEPINVPDLLEGEVRVSKVTTSNKDKFTASQQMTLAMAANRIESRVHWDGQGAERFLVYTRTETLNNKCIAVSTFTHLPGKFLKLKSFEKVVTSPSGKSVQKEFYDFTDPTLKYPPVLVHPFTLEIAFKSFDIKPGSQRKFALWLNSAAVLNMEAVVVGPDVIDLPNEKKVKCVKIQMKPNFTQDFGAFANKMITPLVPDYSFWIRTDGSKCFVKYVGPMGQISPVNAPTETHEMVSFTPGKNQ